MTNLAPSKETTDMAIETSGSYMAVRGSKVNLMNDLYELREDDRETKRKKWLRRRRRRKEADKPTTDRRRAARPFALRSRILALTALDITCGVR